ncbi:MAG: hypothetical protein LBL15_03645, partial [Oscillospiraceae bacterium]|nr:hypothetical protein [Oscillospiraceae bacterium]
MDENTNKPGYICGRCGAVTDYPKAFCRKCYREQVCISAFLIVFALVVIAIVNTYFLGNGVRLG